eukprot:Nitzschia sp. Nitz4//scaffold45_size130396//97951//99093//NITZ4_003465-RA/size130396-processed-gene-0.226-mRNA-1//-1//CDS//3329552446//7670//frame0
MFPDPSVMSLAGWSNQFVDESLWDTPNDGSQQVSSFTSAMANRKTNMMEGTELTWKHISQMCDPRTAAANASAPYPSVPTSRLMEPFNASSDGKSAKNVIEEVLRDLNDVVDNNNGVATGGVSTADNFASAMHFGLNSYTQSQGVPELNNYLQAQQGFSIPTTLAGAFQAHLLEHSNMQPALSNIQPPLKKRRLTSTGSQQSCNSGVAAGVDDDAGDKRFRDYQNKQWDEAFEELLEFRKKRGNCQVPHGFKENPSLSRWVKRQRYQYKLLKEGKPSTMTEERIERLENVGFVWDSHNTTWERRIAELQEYRRVHGHASVPTSYKENMKLATWVKQQRRQYKLFCQGRPSNITLERIEQLQSLGFEWSIRIRQGQDTVAC